MEAGPLVSMGGNAATLTPGMWSGGGKLPPNCGHSLKLANDTLLAGRRFNWLSPAHSEALFASAAGIGSCAPRVPDKDCCPVAPERRGALAGSGTKSVSPCPLIIDL